jgi:CheY-like chemotaxis protein
MNKVLVVEDEQVLSQAYRMILESESYDVTVAEDGTEALDLVTNNLPDIILLDLRMPKMGGIEFLKRFKESHPKAPTKVIVFSNLDSQKEIDEVYALGADKYMIKSWASPKELVRIVAEILSEK